MLNKKNHNDMNTTLIKAEIEKAAKEANATEIEIIQIMQGECAKLGDEKSIEILHKIKMQYIKQ